MILANEKKRRDTRVDTEKSLCTHSQLKNLEKPIGNQVKIKGSAFVLALDVETA